MPERRYEVSRHARERMAERYQIELAPETWQALVEGIEDWPHELDHKPNQGAEVRVAHVQLHGPDGTLLVLPIVYLTSRWRVAVLTVKPHGFRLRRPHATPHP